MSGKSSRASRKSIEAAPASKRSPADSWTVKTLEELIAEQGVRPIGQLEEILGRGADLWRDDVEFELFLTALRERRQKGG